MYSATLTFEKKWDFREEMGKSGMPFCNEYVESDSWASLPIAKLGTTSGKS